MSLVCLLVSRQGFIGVPSATGEGVNLSLIWGKGMLISLLVVFFTIYAYFKYLIAHLKYTQLLSVNCIQIMLEI